MQLPRVLTAVPYGWQGAANWASPGFQVVIKDADGNAGSNPITVQAHEGDTMDGESTLTIGEDYGCVRLAASEARRWAIL